MPAAIVLDRRRVPQAALDADQPFEGQTNADISGSAMIRHVETVKPTQARAQDG
jgi:hypothetical protein